jgi:quinol monooxygenase YgiN
MDAVLALPGCQGCELAVDVKNPENFHFSERWDSPEAHQAAGPKLPAAALDAMKGAIGAPPVGTGLNSLLAK